MGTNKKESASKVRPYRTLLMILGVSIVAAAITLPFLPEQIPLHFGSSGEVTQYGSKYTVFLIALIPAVAYIGIKRRYGVK